MLLTLFANHEAHDYAERSPRRMPKMREAIGSRIYALWLMT